MLGTNCRDYAIVFTQLEAQEEAFSTVELYSECAGSAPPTSLTPARNRPPALRLRPASPRTAPPRSSLRQE